MTNKEKVYCSDCFFNLDYIPYKKVRESIPVEELEAMAVFLKGKSQNMKGFSEIQKFRHKETGKVIKFIHISETWVEDKGYSIVLFDEENTLAEL